MAIAQAQIDDINGGVPAIDDHQVPIAQVPILQVHNVNIHDQVQALNGDAIQNVNNQVDLNALLDDN